MQTISATKTNSYNQDEITNSIRRHFVMIDVKKMINPNMKVLLKPNLLMKRKPEEFTTTHPTVVAGIAICLKELGITDITIADSPGGTYTKQALTGIYEASGMREISEKYNLKLNYDFGSYESKVKNGVKVQNFTLINPVKNADFIIDVAKLKTHAMTTLSGAVKNIFGTVPGLMKPEFHFRFPEKKDFSNMIVDLCETVKPNLCFVDAVTAMQGDGPSAGTSREVNAIFCSKSPYNLDVVLCSVINAKIIDVPIVQVALERGLCVDNIKKLNIVGDQLPVFEDYILPKSKGIDFLNNVPKCFKKPLTPIVNLLLTSKPIIKRKKCIGCGKCAESCPAQTIKIQDKKAYISYDECIKCFCCHEMCPVKAIDIKRFKLFDK